MGLRYRETPLVKQKSRSLTKVNKSAHLYDRYHGHYPIKAQTNIPCTNVLGCTFIYVQRWKNRNNCYILFYRSVHVHNYKIHIYIKANCYQCFRTRVQESHVIFIYITAERAGKAADPSRTFCSCVITTV